MTSFARTKLGLFSFLTIIFIGVFHSFAQTPLDERKSKEIERAKQMILEAEELSKSDDPDALFSAEDRFKSALKICREQSLLDCEEYLLYKIGLINKRSEDYKEAILYFEESLKISELQNRHLNEAQARWNIGIVLFLDGMEDRAKDYFLTAIKILEEDGQWGKVGFAYVDLAETLSKRSRFLETLSYYKQALNAFNKAGDVNSEVLTLVRIGDTYSSLNLYADSKTFYEQAKEEYRKKGSVESEQWVYGKICQIIGHTGNLKDSLSCYEKLLSTYKDLKDSPSHLFTLSRIGSLQYQLGKYKEAIRTFDQNLSLSRKFQHPNEEATALYYLGISTRSLGKRIEALEYLKGALDLSRTQRMGILEWLVLSEKAYIYLALGQRERAVSFFTQALDKGREQKDLGLERSSLTDLGLLYHNSKDYEKALPLLQEALEIAIREDKKDRQASLLLLIGEAHYGLRQYDQILSKYEAALSIAQELKDKIAEADALGSVSAFHMAVGQYEKANTYYQKILSIASETKNDELKGDALLGLGESLIGLKEYQKAQSFFEQALTLSKKTKSKYLESSALIGIGIVLFNSNHLSKAEDTLRKAYTIAKNADEPYRESDAANELAKVLIKLKKHDQAKDYAEKALVLGWQLNNPEREAYALFTLMQVLQSMKRPDEGIFYGKQLINMVQFARQRLVHYGKEVHKDFVKDKEGFYRVLAETLISEGRLAEAEQVLSMLKEEEYFDFVRRDGKVSEGLLAELSLSPEEKKAFDEYKKYADDLTAIGKELGELQVESRQYEVGKFPKQARLEELEKQIERSNIVFTAFLDSLKLKFGERDVRVNTLESGTQALLKELKEPHTVFVSTIAGEEKLNIIVTTADAQKAYSIPVKAEDLNRLVAEFRMVLRNPTTDPRQSGKALYDVLFPAGLLKDLENVKADTIVWSLDGTLRYIPISALWDGSNYLVERFNNVVVTLASRDKLNVSSVERSKWNALGVGVSKEVVVKESDGTSRNFPALKAVPEELCGVINDPDAVTVCERFSNIGSGVINGRTLMDENFTFRNFKDSLSRFPIVHVASHFNLNAGNESDSYLLLGGGEDRRLSLATLRQSGTQFSGVELLALSACNTAMTGGSRANGLEIEGFGAMAQRGGAKSVLASLWAVADSSTRDLMVNFYRRLEQDNISKADALRKAQLELLKGKNVAADDATRRSSDIIKLEGDTPEFKAEPKAPFSHPYYWSPFILIGNWQ